jgi:hypothetical protein
MDNGSDFLREWMLAAAVGSSLYIAGMFLAKKCWWRGDSSDDQIEFFPWLSAGLVAAAFLAWMFTVVGSLIGLDLRFLLGLLEAWGTGRVALGVLLFTYFYAESVGIFGTTSLRGRVLESSAFAASALVLCWAGGLAATSLGLPASMLGLGWTSGQGLALLRPWLALVVAGCAVRFPTVWLLLAAAGTLRPEKSAGGGTPRLCWRAVQALVVVASGTSVDDWELAAPQIVLLVAGYVWDAFLV